MVNCANECDGLCGPYGQGCRSSHSCSSMTCAINIGKQIPFMLFGPIDPIDVKEIKDLKILLVVYLIALKFLTSKSEVVDIGNQFGLTLYESQKYIDFGVDILISVLTHHSNSSIHWPVDNQEYLEEMRHLLRLYVPELQHYAMDVLGFIDAV